MKTKHQRRNIRRPLAIAIGIAIAQSAAAQSLLEEVIVTAQKREQNLQDVPVAVTAFTGEQMSALGVQESFDIAAFSPGVHISGNLAGQNTQFSIRGVTQNDFNDIIEAPNAVYLDEGYIAVAQAQTFAVYDIARVEILKGPQGTLFGRNATGGLVHYVSNKPTFDETTGYVDLTTGQFDTPNNANRHTLEAALSGPLGDKVAARAALRYNRQDPYLENRYPETAFLPAPGEGAGADLGDDDTIAGRLSLAFQPTDTLQIDLSANYADSEVSTGPFQSKSTIGVIEGGELVNVIDTPPGETRLTIDGDGDGGADAIDGDQFLPGGGIGLPGRLAPGADFFGYLDPDGDDFTFSGDFAFKDQGYTESSGLNARVAWDLSANTSFTAITDWKRYEKLLFIDVDSAPANQLANYAGVDATSFSQELRLTGESDNMRWVAGLYYLNIDNQSDNGLKAPANSIAGGAPFAPVDIGVVAELETNSYSVFGQLDYDLTPTLTATAGLRLMREEKDYDMALGVFPSFDNYSVNRGDFIPNAFGAGSPYFYEDETSDPLWTGKLQLDWHPSDTLMIYAGVNRGVKAGSFNAPLLGAYLGSGGNSAIAYDEEVLISYEGGFKATLGDGLTRLNGSVFYYDYSDYQAFLFVGVGGVVINADAETYGAELELTTSPIDGLDLMFNAAYFDATVKDIPLRFGSPLPPRDVKPTYAPELQATALARYAWDMFGGTMALQGDLSYSDEFYYNLRNFDADKFDSYTMVNAQLSWQSPSAAWTTTLAVRNITDERAGVQGFDLATLCGCNEVSYRAPRFYSVGLRYEF
ncbi:TonB-dependent receptor [Parahaliea mediterranea]|uniref:TonB-dependent receptor n=1 Tax=Parahaliea mediterranea TaxID=651086 RepID=A0A939DDI1_9GAMM|nr:TonB-dependent receptor [Parahaliea mediterranea]MBN7795577.1 TonB-dependent receptor [Parahaliea mediterranea]